LPAAIFVDILPAAIRMDICLRRYLLIFACGDKGGYLPAVIRVDILPAAIK
jgi:hypothetical protein